MSCRAMLNHAMPMRYAKVKKCDDEKKKKKKNQNKNMMKSQAERDGSCQRKRRVREGDSGTTLRCPNHPTLG
jgi:hypothetical protein